MVWKSSASSNYSLDWSLSPWTDVSRFQTRLSKAYIPIEIASVSAENYSFKVLDIIISDMMYHAPTVN